MNVQITYGTCGLVLQIPDEVQTTIVEPEFLAGVEDPWAAVMAALHSPRDAQPLHNLVRPEQTVGIVFSDITRPVPNQILIPCLLEALAHVPPDNITLYNALGSHRQNTREELIDLLGEPLVNNVRIVQNNAFDPGTQICIGRTSTGNEIWINRAFYEADFKILTGFIEPHMFAGFSGGAKAVLPGMAGQASILNNHNPSNIGHVKASWGITQGNPIWEEMQAILPMLGPSFLLNVTLNRDKNITGVFAGGVTAAHLTGCEFVRETAMVAVDEPFDIVITSNSGYPLDQNLYQSVKGISAAAQIVRPGGSILMAAECRDGIPEHGLYASLLKETTGPDELLERICAPGFQAQDQWQLQIQARILQMADVYVYSENLSAQQIEQAHFRPSEDPEITLVALLEQYGSQASVCVLPEGPHTIPYVRATG